MTVRINYKSSSLKKKSNNIVLFVDENFNISNLKKHLSIREYSFISELQKIKEKKKKIISYNFNSKKTITLVSIKKKLKSSDGESLGAKFYDQFKDSKHDVVTINSDTVTSNLDSFLGSFLHGLKLKSYRI